MSKSRETQIKMLNALQKENKPVDHSVLDAIIASSGKKVGKCEVEDTLYRMALEIKVWRLNNKLYGC